MYSNVWVMKWTCTLITIETNLWCCVFYFTHTNCTLGICYLAISRWKQFWQVAKAVANAIPKSQFQASWCQFCILASLEKVESKGAEVSMTVIGLLFCWWCQFFLNNETFVNSKMLIKRWAAILVLVITFLHSGILALIHCSEKLQYRHMQI